MSYAAGAALQAAVFQSLSEDAVVQSLSAGHVYEAMPAGAVPDLYVVLGPEKVRDAGDVTGRGAVHDFEVSVVTEAAGFLSAKTLAAAVSDRLANAELPLSAGQLVGLWFRSARARHVNGHRRIDMGFRARVDLP